jgi:hypothetical protein
LVQANRDDAKVANLDGFHKMPPKDARRRPPADRASERLDLALAHLLLASRVV